MDNQENKNSDSQGAGESIKTLGAFIWDLVKILVIAAIIVVPFRMFIAEPFVVSGSSMQPNFQNHDYLIVDRLSYITGNPQRGDVIVLLYPKDTSQFFIKRIIGLPGETVCFNRFCDAKYQSDGHVYIENSAHAQPWLLTEPYLVSENETTGSPQPVKLGSNEFFVLGDNRTASSDSRVWGILPRGDIVGRVWARIYPLSTAGFFQTPSY